MINSATGSVKRAFASRGRQPRPEKGAIDMTQRVLVTAGAAGIGREIARAFVESGARVCVCDIDGTALASAASEIPD
jgi:hypothetical protein